MTGIDEIWLWNKRLEHLNFDQIVKLSKKNVVKDLPRLSKPNNIISKSCQLGKKARVSFKGKENTSEKPLHLVHMDLCGPSTMQSTMGKLYFMLIVDDFSRMIWVSFLREKFEAFDEFKEFKTMAENETDCKIKSIRSNNGGEFTSREFDDFYKSNGIKRQFTILDTP